MNRIYDNCCVHVYYYNFSYMTYVACSAADYIVIVVPDH